VVRNASKLQKLLEDKGFDHSKHSSLRIVEGSAKDIDACSKTLVDPQTSACASIVIYGIGGQMDFSNPFNPTLSDPHVCAETSETILKSLSLLSPPNPPLMAVISTTGISSERDVPLLMLPLCLLYPYGLPEKNWVPLADISRADHFMLSVPHADKAVLEEQIMRAPKASIRDWIIIRPSFLLDREVTFNDLKAGYEGRETIGGGKLTKKEGGTGWQGISGLPIGYGVARSDVGRWIYEEVIVGGGSEWIGKKVNLTW